MTSSDERTTVVFLGPSLAHDAARALLDARYLPPAQFGDVYRWIGGDVSTIVLIDGIFHSRAPVWQRELLYAIQSGIRVYGAASMGALRAAELHTHGMSGLGTVFRWYTTGEIDGDDEVALLHTGPEQGYRALSEPLVNIRFNLVEAVARGVLAHDEAAAVVRDLKALPFWERTMDALWNAPALSGLDEHRRADLRVFFERHAIDLKRRDATQALALLKVERLRREPSAAVMTATPTTAPGIRPTGSYYERHRLLKRGIPRGQGQLVEGQALVDRVFAEPTRRKLIQRALAARFFVREWARERQVSVPAEQLAAMELAFREQVVTAAEPAWLIANGLTAAEHRELLTRHLLWKWLLAQAPERFGLASGLRDEALLPASPELGLLQPLCERESLAASLPYVAAWCASHGAIPGAGATRAVSTRWSAALETLRGRHGDALGESFIQAIWALEMGPIHFGFTTWSTTAELLCELQITGTAARLATTWEASAP